MDLGVYSNAPGWYLHGFGYRVQRVWAHNSMVLGTCLDGLGCRVLWVWKHITNDVDANRSKRLWGAAESVRNFVYTIEICRVLSGWAIVGSCRILQIIVG